MKKRFLVLFTVPMILACRSLPNKTSKLPPLVECRENPNVVSEKPIWDRLTDINDLSFSLAYNTLLIQSDSLEREIIRNTNAKISRIIVKEKFPEIELLSEATLKVKNYNFIMGNLGKIYWNLPYDEAYKAKTGE